jgi:hypothetical protein
MRTSTAMNRSILVHILTLGVGLSGVGKATLLLPVYTPIACGGQGQVVCSVQPTGVPPTAAQLQGLNTNLAAAYLGSRLNFTVDPAFLFLSPRVANVNGYVIGGMNGFAAQGLIDTQFIYHAGQITCCAAGPFSLLDINNQNIVVGSPIAPGFSSFIADASVADADMRGLTLTFTDPTFGTGSGAFLAIDNQDRILFRGISGQEWILDPASNPAAVPEPSSVFLLLTVVGGLAFTMRRRLFHPKA